MLTVKSNLFPTASNFFDDDWNSLFDWKNRNFPNKSTALPVNVRENDNEYIVELAAPGMKKENFQIELNNNVLSVKGETKNEYEENDNNNYTRKEFSYQSFQRSFNLNEEVVDESQIKATYTDGILNILIPKKKEVETKKVRTIQIS